MSMGLRLKFFTVIVAITSFVIIYCYINATVCCVISVKEISFLYNPDRDCVRHTSAISLTRQDSFCRSLSVVGQTYR